MSFATHYLEVNMSWVIFIYVSDSPCPAGVPVARCLVDPCSVSSCESNSKAKCKANYCGGCNAEWFDGQGLPVKCEKETESMQVKGGK